MGVPDTDVIAHHLADITTEPDRLALLEGLARDVLDQRHVDVEVGDRRSAEHVAQVLDGVGAARHAGRTRVVDQADVVVDRQLHVLGRELLRGDHAVAVELAVLVDPLPIEPLGRGTEVDAEHAIDDAEKVGLLGPGGPDTTLGDRPAQ